MRRRLLRAIVDRETAARAEQAAIASATLDHALAQRRQGRGKRNARSRRGQATRIHAAWKADTMIHGEARF